jgi:hypothetical protein
MMNLNSIICDKYRASLAYIHHLKKATDCSLLDRNTGPTAIASSVRAVYTVLPVSAYVRKVVLAKMNILGHVPCELMAALAESQLVIYNSTEKSESSQLARAEKWLIEMFLKQRNYRARDIYREGERAGFSESTLKEAKKNLPIDSYNEGVGTPWYWTCERFLIKTD